jgi:putative ABC transport system permease protein
MNFYSIAFNNLKRRKLKMAFLLFALVLGVSTILTIFTIVQAMSLELGDRIDEFGANILIVPRSEGVELRYEGAHISNVSFDIEQLTERDLLIIDEIPERRSINIISPKIGGTVTAGEQEVIIIGVKSRQEFSMKPWFTLSEQTGLSGENTNDLALLELPEDALLLGSSAAKALQKKAGDSLQINGKPFEVFGVLKEMGVGEDGLIYADLPVVQNLLVRPGELSMIEISAYCNFCPIEEIVAQLEEAMPNGRATALRQAALVREETIERFAAFGFALSVLVLLISVLGVFSSMLSSVYERTREIGILRSIGFRRVHIMQVIILEAVMVSLPGGFLGYIMGSLLSRGAGPFLAQMQISLPWRVDLLLPSVFLAVVMAVSASVYPALRAASLDPIEALRHLGG